MTTTTSSSKGKNGILTILRQDLRRVRSLTVFYGALSLLFFPVQYLLQVLNPTEYMDRVTNLPALRYNLYGPGEIYGVASYVLFFPLMILMAFLFATQLVSYMQNKRAVDVYHALPVTRVQMMTAHFAAGMTALGLPLLVNFLIVGAIKTIHFGPAGLGAVAMEYLCWMITLFVMFGITAFAAVNVGTLFDTAVFALALNGVVPLVYLLGLCVFSIGLYGYVANFDPLLKMHPLVLMVLRQADDPTQIVTDTLTIHQLLSRWFPIWLGIGLIIMVATIWLYHRRKSENAESLETSAPLKVVIKLAGTFIGAVLLGMLFQGIFGETFSADGSLYAQRYFIGGTLVGSVITFLTIEAILARGFKTIRKNLPACLLVTCALGGFVMTVYTGGLGYSTRVPKSENVAQVMVNYAGLGHENSTITRADDSFYGYQETRNTTLSSPQAVALITDLHQAQISNWKQGRGQETNLSGARYDRYISRTLEITYRLKSGMTMRRQYTLEGDAVKLLVDLETNDEFLEETNPLFQVKPSQVTSAILLPPTGERQIPLTLTGDKTSQLLEALRQDLQAQTAQLLLAEDAHPVAFVDLEFRGLPYRYASSFQYNQISQPIGPSFTHTLTLLDSWGYAQQLAPDFSNLASVYATFTEGDYYFRSESVLWSSTVGENVLGNQHYSVYSKGNSNYFTENPEMIAQLFEKSTTVFYPNRPSLILQFIPTEAYALQYYNEYRSEIISKEEYLSDAQYGSLSPKEEYSSDVQYGSASSGEAELPAASENADTQMVSDNESYIPVATAIRFLAIEDIPQEIRAVLEQSDYIAQIMEDYENYRNTVVPVLTQARLR